MGTTLFLFMPSTIAFRLDNEDLAKLLSECVALSSVSKDRESQLILSLSAFRTSTKSEEFANHLTMALAHYTTVLATSTIISQIKDHLKEAAENCECPRCHCRKLNEAAKAMPSATPAFLRYYSHYLQECLMLESPPDTPKDALEEFKELSPDESMMKQTKDGWNYWR